RDHVACAEAGCFIQGHRVLLREAVSRVFSVEYVRPAMLLWVALKGDAANVSNALRLPIPLVRRSRSLRGIRACNMSMFRKDFVAVNGFNEDFEGWGKEDSELAVRLFRNGTLRKDVKFRACCFHLYHSHFDRSGLRRNEQLLARAMESEERFCKSGVDKYL
ncbi:MAG: galactosyltransferase-related protein, partial [Thermodesulfovibrionales bacterium]